MTSVPAASNGASLSSPNTNPNVAVPPIETLYSPANPNSPRHTPELRARIRSSIEQTSQTPPVHSAEGINRIAPLNDVVNSLLNMDLALPGNLQRPMSPVRSPVASPINNFQVGSSISTDGSSVSPPLSSSNLDRVPLSSSPPLSSTIPPPSTPVRLPLERFSASPPISPTPSPPKRGGGGGGGTQSTPRAISAMPTSSSPIRTNPLPRLSSIMTSSSMPSSMPSVTTPSTSSTATPSVATASPPRPRPASPRDTTQILANGIPLNRESIPEIKIPTSVLEAVALSREITVASPTAGLLREPAVASPTVALSREPAVAPPTVGVLMEPVQNLPFMAVTPASTETLTRSVDATLATIGTQPRPRISAHRTQPETSTVPEVTAPPREVHVNRNVETRPIDQPRAEPSVLIPAVMPSTRAPTPPQSVPPPQPVPSHQPAPPQSAPSQPVPSPQPAPSEVHVNRAPALNSPVPPNVSYPMAPPYAPPNAIGTISQVPPNSHPSPIQTEVQHLNMQNMQNPMGQRLTQPEGFPQGFPPWMNPYYFMQMNPQLLQNLDPRMMNPYLNPAMFSYGNTGVGVQGQMPPLQMPPVQMPPVQMPPPPSQPVQMLPVQMPPVPPPPPQVSEPEAIIRPSSPTLRLLDPVSNNAFSQEDIIRPASPVQSIRSPAPHAAVGETNTVEADPSLSTEVPSTVSSPVAPSAIPSNEAPSEKSVSDVKIVYRDGKAYRVVRHLRPPPAPAPPLPVSELKVETSAPPQQYPPPPGYPPYPPSQYPPYPPSQYPPYPPPPGYPYPPYPPPPGYPPGYPQPPSNRPNYLTMNAEQRAGYRAKFRINFDKLRVEYPHYRIPEFAENISLDVIHSNYERYIRQIHVDQSSIYYKTIVVVIFLAIELIGVKLLKMDFGGFALNQLNMINRYERLLNELGEKSYGGFGSSWPVEVRILMLALFNALIFIIFKMVTPYVGQENGAAIQGLINNFLSGAGGPATGPPILDANGNPSVPEIPARSNMPDLSNLVGNIGSLFTGMGGGSNTNTGNTRQRARRRPQFRE